MNLFENLQTLHESGIREKYSFYGDYFRFDRKIGEIPKNKPLYTIAKSKDEAISNFCKQIKDMKQLFAGANLTIDKNNVSIVDDIVHQQVVKDSQPGVDDPKFNFDDPDREGDYQVESIMSYDDWFTTKYDDLVLKYIERNELEEDDPIDNDDFKEFCEYEYEDYYRNTNRYNEANEESYVYKISFDVEYEGNGDYDCEHDTLKNIEYDESDLIAIDNDSFISEFQKWYNDGGDNINIISLKYEPNKDSTKLGNIIAILDSKLSNEKEFASELLFYILDESGILVTVTYSGTREKDSWNQTTDSHTTISEPFEDYIEDINCYYTDVKNIKIELAS